MEFSSLQLHPDLQRGIADAGYVACMPVQEQVLTHAFNGQDLYVQSQTGTGKTAAFLAVIFQRLLTEPLLGGKKALIMVPTRELAVQVEEEAKTLGKYLPFKTGSFYGGVGYAQQQSLLRANVQVLVGTPGRVLDLNKSGYMNLMDLAFLVLDEADRMFDMGFYPDLRKLIKVVPPADRRQTMLFSATLNAWVKNLAWEYTKTPYEIEIEPETVTVEEVEQLLYHVQSEDKMRLLLGILRREQPESAIIFCNTKRYAEIVAKRLRVNGIDCEFIIGDLPQSKRLKIIDDVKSGAVRFLVATDVAARGLDIEGLALVVNYDLPAESENYVHRIGRTARAGKTGKAVTLASEQDVYELADIEKYIGKKIPSQVAGEEFFAEDKSEGLRIRTDFYDDRARGHEAPRGRREGGRGTPRGTNAGRGPERHGGGRVGGRDDEERAGGREDRGGRRAGSGGRGPARQTGAARRGPGVEDRGTIQEPAAGDPNLAGLSFEQRMAYYKEKYGERGADGKHGKTERGAAKQGETPRAPDGNRRDGRRSKNRSGRGRENRAARSGGESLPPARETDGKQAGGGQTAAPEPKKGILSRLFGIFGNRKE
jgi:ATP-dependent RNA helicase RhlB